jgi:hypothetical protein
VSVPSALSALGTSSLERSVRLLAILGMLSVAQSVWQGWGVMGR